MSKEVIYITSFKESSLDDFAQSLCASLEKEGKNVSLLHAFDGDTIIEKTELQELIAQNDLRSVIARFNEAIESEKGETIVVKGAPNISFDANFPFDINMEIAKHLNATVVTKINAQNKTHAQLSSMVRNEIATIDSFGLEIFAIIVSNYPDPIAANTACKYSFVHFVQQDKHEFNQDKIHARINIRSNITTGIAFENQLFVSARQAGSTIVLPEGDEERILRACEVLLKNDIAKIVLLGDEAHIQNKINSLGLKIQNIQIIDPKTSSLKDEFANDFYELRKAKGVSLEDAQKIMLDVSYFGTMMVHKGLADGMVSGAVHTTADTIRPALQIIKTNPGISVVSSIFFMCLDTQTLIFGDCAVNPNPNPQELAQIATSSAQTAQSFGFEPKVAMLSYSTGSSGAGADVQKVVDATKLAKDGASDISIDGPLQFDAAFVPSVAKSKMPDSDVAGKANVFIMPDLNTGNITYKAVQRTANAIAIGPVLQGLRKPVNDLSRGCLVDDIINTVAITAIQGGKK